MSFPERGLPTGRACCSHRIVSARAITWPGASAAREYRVAAVPAAALREQPGPGESLRLPLDGSPRRSSARRLASSVPWKMHLSGKRRKFRRALRRVARSSWRPFLLQSTNRKTRCTRGFATPRPSAFAHADPVGSLSPGVGALSVRSRLEQGIGYAPPGWVPPWHRHPLRSVRDERCAPHDGHFEDPVRYDREQSVGRV